MKIFRSNMRIFILFTIVSYVSGCKKDKTPDPQSQPVTTSQIKFVKIWSEQFPSANNFNYLPGNAGSAGSVAMRIIMGTKDNSTAYAGAELSFSNPQASSLAKVRFSTDNAGIPVLYGSGSLNGNIASISMFTDAVEDVPKEYSLVAWIDANQNDLIDNGESYTLSNGRFTIVNKNKYEALQTELSVYAYVGFAFPRSRAFALSFLQNQAVNYGGVYQSAPISFSSIENTLQSSLAYKVGVDLNTAGLSTIRNFYFGANSLLANDIRASQTFNDSLNKIIQENSNYIYQNYCTQNSFTFPLPALIEYNDANFQIGDIDYDLHFTFNSAIINGNITVGVICNNGQVEIESLKITGKLIDLYDFNYANQNPLSFGHKFALIQGGYGTLGNSGQIARIEVNLDTTLTNFSYSFGSCALPVLGAYTGTYNWDCGNGNSGSSVLSLQFNDNCGHLSGTANYLGGSSNFIGVRYSGATFNQWGEAVGGTFDPNGNVIQIEIDSCADFVRNKFAGTISGITISGFTLNGDSPVLGSSGCSHPGMYSGTFNVSQ